MSIKRKEEKARYLITQVANKFSLHCNTIRNWERRGIIKPQRDWRGARIFFDEDVERIREIIQKRRLGD